MGAYHPAQTDGEGCAFACFVSPTSGRRSAESCIQDLDQQCSNSLGVGELLAVLLGVGKWQQCNHWHKGYWDCTRIALLLARSVASIKHWCSSCHGCWQGGWGHSTEERGSELVLPTSPCLCCAPKWRDSRSRGHGKTAQKAGWHL